MGEIVHTSRIRIVREAFSVYLPRCPAAQSVIGCIDIQDELKIEEVG